MRYRDKGKEGGRGGVAVGKCMQHPVSPRHAYSTRTAHTQSERASRVADESTRGGQLNNRATQWEAGEGSCTVRAAAITARGSNGEHLATEHHSHSPLFVSGGLRAMVVGGFKSERKGRGWLKD